MNMYAKEISNIIEDMTIPITALIFIRSPDFIDLILKIPIVVPEIAKIIGKEDYHENYSLFDRIFGRV